MCTPPFCLAAPTPARARRDYARTFTQLIDSRANREAREQTVDREAGGRRPRPRPPNQDRRNPVCVSSRAQMKSIEAFLSLALLFTCPVSGTHASLTE